MKKVWSVLAALLLIILLPGMAMAATSGTCGDNLTWTLDNYVLTISGTGAMTDYTEGGWWKESGSTGTPVVKQVILGEGITHIGSYAFLTASRITSITIPDTVTSIGENAFSSCYSLSNVTLSNKVETIGDYAFYMCSALTSIDLPETLKSIGEHAFDQCDLSGVNIPDSVTEMGDSAFLYNKNLKTLTIGTGISVIPTCCFEDCSSLTEVDIPENITEIGQQAFYECSSLAKVTLHEGLKKIGILAFAGKSGYPDFAITLPDGLESIGMNAFNGRNFQSVALSIPASVKEVGAAAFQSTNLASVKFLGDNTDFYSYVLAKCSSLTDVTLPGNITTLPSGTFYQCTALKEIKLPKQLKVIQYTAFSGCDNLADVFFGGSKEEWESIDVGYDNDILKNVTVYYNGETKKEWGIYTKDNSDSVKSFSFRNGSLIPVTANGASYDSSFILKFKDPDWEESGVSSIKVILPDGFSFSYDEVVQTKEFEVSTSLELKEIVYPLFASKCPANGELTFEVSYSGKNFEHDFPVAKYADSKKVYTQNGEQTVEIDSSSDYWWDLGNGNFDEEKCWLADTLAFPDEDSDGRKRTYQSLQNLGFVDINEVALDNDKNHLPCFMGVRTVICNGEVRHIVAMVNIGDYGAAQWIGNFTVQSLENLIGEDEEVHDGFDRLGQYLEEKLLEYCDENQIRTEKSALFVTGHSRAAAGSSIIVHDIGCCRNAQLGNFKDSVAYTFACPNTVNDLYITPSDDINIHNIVYERDLVPFVPPWSMYHKYGKTYVFTDALFPERARNPLNEEILNLCMGDVQALMTVADIKASIDIPLQIFRKIKAACEYFADDLRSRGLEEARPYFTVLDEIWTAHSNETYLYKKVCKAHSMTYLEAHAILTAQAVKDQNACLVKLTAILGYDVAKYAAEKVSTVVTSWIGNAVKWGKDMVTSFWFGCPVNITIISSSTGDVLARFVDHELVECNTDLITAVGTGEFSFLLINGDTLDYNIQIEGTDIGTMDVYAGSWDANDKLTGTYKAENVPVHLGETYELKPASASSTAKTLKLTAKAKAVAQGSLNSAITWTLWDSGHLDITGKGTMPDFTADSVPAYGTDTEDAPAIKSIEFGFGITGIGSYAVSGLSEVTSVLIPDSVTAIGEGAFSGCSALASVKYSAGEVKYLSTKVQIGDHNEPLTEAAWSFDNSNVMEEIKGLARFDLPAKLTTVGDSAFAGVAAEVIVAGSSCESIGDGAFADCGSLVCLIVPEGCTVSDTAFGDRHVVVVKQ